MKGDGSQSTVRFTIPEGYNVSDIAALLVKNGILSSQNKFLELAKSQETFKNYIGIDEIKPDDKRPRIYNLEATHSLTHTKYSSGRLNRK